MVYAQSLVSVSALAQDINASATGNLVLWDGTAYANRGFSLAGGSSLALPETGFYRIDMTLNYEVLSNLYTGFIVMEHDIGAGFVDVGIRGYGNTFTNNANDFGQIVHPSTIIHYSSGDSIRFSVDRENDTTAANLVANASLLTVELLRW